MFMKGQNQKTKKMLLRNQLKGMRQIDALSRYRENIAKKRKKIEQLYEESVPNQIYIFPRAKRGTSDSSETDSESLQKNCESQTYDLKSQNKKDKNYQTASQRMIRCNSLTTTQPERFDSKSKKGMESQRFKKQAIDDAKHEGNQSNYQTKSRKEKNEEKTATNSGKKLFYLPSNVSNKGHSKKPSETIIVSFRGKHGQKSKGHNKTEIY